MAGSRRANQVLLNETAEVLLSATACREMYAERTCRFVLADHRQLVARGRCRYS